MGRLIEVVDFDPAWSAAFEAEATALRRVFGPVLLDVHHVGSTSVPGLSAKPVIDILAVLRETGTIGTFDPQMLALGYRVRGECLDAEVPGTPGRFYYSRESQGVRSHHVHACALGHPEVADMLALPDFLLAHPAQAADYASLKRRLAHDHHHDNIAYMRGKDAFIKALLAEARNWRAVTTAAALTCPRCAARSHHPMPTDACQFFLECPACHAVLRPRAGDCCVFCSYADVRCPSQQPRDAVPGALIDRNP